MRSSLLRRATYRGVSPSTDSAAEPRRPYVRPSALAARAALLGLTACALAAPMAHAADAADTGGAGGHSAQAAAVKRFDIPAGPLSRVVNQFAVEAGIQISVEAALTANLTSPGVTGQHSVESGFASLLAGTGLAAVSRGGGEYTLRRMPARSGAGAEAVALAPVTVMGAKQGLPPAYAGGQVARGGRVGMLGDKDVMDTPFSQTNYTKRTIENQQAATVQDILSNDPSVLTTSRSGANEDVEILRGFRADAVMGGRTLNGLAGMAPLGFPSTDYIERVGVLRGPSSLLNGMAIAVQGGIGGSVDLVTKQATDDPITEITTRYASDSQFGAHIDFGRRFGTNKAMGIRFNGALDGGDTAIDDQSLKFGTAALNLDYRGERVRLSADFAHQSHETSPGLNLVDAWWASNSFGHMPKAPDSRINLVPDWSKRKVKSTVGMLRGEIDILDNVTAYGAIGTQRHSALERGTTIPELQDESGSYLFYPRVSDYTVDVLSMQGGLRATTSTGPIGHALSLNVQRSTYKSNNFNWEDWDNPIEVDSIYHPVFPGAPTLPETGGREPWVRQKTSSIGFADTLSFLDDRIQFTAGIRRQQVDADSWAAKFDGHAWTPATALVIKPWENVSFYGNYIEDLKPGNTVSDEYANAGEVFSPYIHKQIEAGVKVDWGRVTTTFAAFQITQQNNMVVMEPGNTLPTLTRNGEQRNRGIELNAYGEVTNGVRLLGGLTLLEARQTKTQDGAFDGERAESAPAVRAVIGAEWDAPFVKGLTLSGRFTYTGDQVINNGSPDFKIPSWTQLDLGARYTFSSPWNDSPIVVRFNVDNVFNDRFWKGSYSNGYVFRSDPRTFRLSATARF